MNITSLVNNDISTYAIDKLLTTFIQVESKSNLIKKNRLKLIESVDDFHYYFPDVKDEYSNSLRTAFRLVKNNYKVLAQNVRSSNHHTTLRVFSNGYARYLDDSLEIEKLKSKVNTIAGNHAISIDLTNFKNAGDYFLLEHTVEGRVTNTIIYLGDDNPLSPNHSSNRHSIPLGLSTEDLINTIKNVLSSNEGYFIKTTDTGLRIAYPYVFDSINNSKNAVLKFDDSFNATYLNSIDDDYKAFDLTSKYNSDIEDLEFEYKVEQGKHHFYIYKHYNDENLCTTEDYEHEDLEYLVNWLNSDSKLINLIMYSDSLIEGKYKLLNYDKNESEITADDYLDASVQLLEYRDKDNKHLFTCNFVYEPDDFATKEIELALINAFAGLDTPMIKLLSYKDDSFDYSQEMITYFNKNKYKYQNEIYSCKELYLILMINNLLDKDNEIVLVDRDESTYPDYVNYFIPQVINVDIPIIKSRFNDHTFDAFDLITISAIDCQINNEKDPTRTKYSLYEIIDEVNDYFTEHLGYNPDVKLVRFEYISNDKIEVDLEYYVKTFNLIQTVNLVLNITGE